MCRLRSFMGSEAAARELEQGGQQYEHAEDKQAETDGEQYPHTRDSPVS